MAQRVVSSWQFLMQMFFKGPTLDMLSCCIWCGVVQEKPMLWSILRYSADKVTGLLLCLFCPVPQINVLPSWNCILMAARRNFQKNRIDMFWGSWTTILPLYVSLVVQVHMCLAVSRCQTVYIGHLSVYLCASLFKMWIHCCCFANLALTWQSSSSQRSEAAFKVLTNKNIFLLLLLPLSPILVRKYHLRIKISDGLHMHTVNHNTRVDIFLFLFLSKASLCNGGLW